VFYYSGEDLALYAGRKLFGGDPVGAGPYVFEGMETVRADRVNSPLSGWGHEYYSRSPAVLEDVDQGIDGREAARRDALEADADAKAPAARSGWRLWQFRADD
jgi:hypothetical protein